MGQLDDNFEDFAELTPDEVKERFALNVAARENYQRVLAGEEKMRHPYEELINFKFSRKNFDSEWDEFTSTMHIYGWQMSQRCRDDIEKRANRVLDWCHRPSQEGDIFE